MNPDFISNVTKDDCWFVGNRESVINSVMSMKETYLMGSAYVKGAGIYLNAYIYLYVVPRDTSKVQLYRDNILDQVIRPYAGEIWVIPLSNKTIVLKHTELYR
ncbi:hypothetical protein NPIL_382081 [Nephila pilipes]|uniref:Uncharacterized protein n=1 Tax=Nephila pilipes TaxID=299642 RepID=A0A8X6PT54_NEPPI|nr:hypothetical protein NPIL_382081 [Nephila pilipes]